MRECILIAAPNEILRVDLRDGSIVPGDAPSGIHPTDVAADPFVPGRAWISTRDHGVLRSDDEGRSWHGSGLASERLMTVAPSPARQGLLWAGADPSALWRSEDAGVSWAVLPELNRLPSAPTWAFPPRPETHHVRWIEPHPSDPGKVWVAIEAGALVSTADGGATWRDRVPGGPYDTHELSIHRDAPDVLRVAAGDGYYESHDGGLTWSSPSDGLEVRYLRSVAIDPGDPEVVVVSGASGPRRAYVAGRSDGRVFRRAGRGHWTRVAAGWPDPPGTIAPLLIAGTAPGEFWAADERGLHLSTDAGSSWELAAAFHVSPDHLRGLALVG